MRFSGKEQSLFRDQASWTVQPCRLLQIYAQSNLQAFHPTDFQSKRSTKPLGCTTFLVWTTLCDVNDRSSSADTRLWQAQAD